MLKVIDGVGGSGIVYVNRRKKTKEVAKFLLEHRISADYYHAGLDHEQRRSKQDRWIHNQCRVVVATNAFGMGIDKPNVRFVIHLDLPESLEAYFQEAGRGGRDGKKAYAVLLMTPSMGLDLRKQVEQSFPDIKAIKKAYLSLGNFFQIPVGGGENQSYEFDIARFSNQYNLNVFDVYHCLHFLEKAGYINLSENFAMPSRLHIPLSKGDLYKIQVSHKMYDSFIKTLLRTYGGLFEGFVKINEQSLANNLKASRQKVIDTLNRLEKLEVVEYEAQSKLPKLSYVRARVDQNALRISKETYHERKKIAFEKLESVLNYAESNHRCRSQMLLEYFGEKNSYRCGICDVCLERNKLELNDLEFSEIEQQLHSILESKPLSLQEVVYLVKGYKEEKVVKVMDFLLDHGKLVLSEHKYRFLTSEKH
jgi:ATP-dependent DNA helicase RecQ